MTDHLEAARDRLGGLHDHLSRREVALAADDLHAILSAILDHLEAQQADDPEPDPLDESNHADRIDRHGTRWAWCDTCGGFRDVEYRGPCDLGRGWTAIEIDEDCGPLTFAPRPADTPTAADPLDESNHTDRIDCYGKRWIWCDGCEGFRLDGHKVHKSNYGWSAVAELDGCYGPLTYPPGECDRG